jgi:hypothetical protein
LVNAASRILSWLLCEPIAISPVTSPEPVEDAMTDPDAPPPIEPSRPDYEPGFTPDEEPMREPPVQPGDDRPYDVSLAPFSSVTSPD